jgi:hypothetical protein
MLSAVVVIALCTVHVHVVWAQALQGTIVPGDRFFSILLDFFSHPLRAAQHAALMTIYSALGAPSCSRFRSTCF